MGKMRSYTYDVAISYAGEDRAQAEALATALQSRGITVFFAPYEQATLWGKNLYTYLSDLYQHKAHYCVTFLSKHYATKLWTNHEREASQARAFQENAEYILPIRLDATDIPGLLPTVAHLNWSTTTPDAVAELLVQKLGK